MVKLTTGGHSKSQTSASRTDTYSNKQEAVWTQYLSRMWEIMGDIADVQQTAQNNEHPSAAASWY